MLQNASYEINFSYKTVLHGANHATQISSVLIQLGSISIDVAKWLQSLKNSSQLSRTLKMTFIFAHIVKPLPQSPVTFHSPIKSKWITEAPPTILFLLNILLYSKILEGNGK